MTGYNYAHFTKEQMLDPMFARFRERTDVGRPAPDGSLVQISDRSSVTLASLWNHQHLVIEFGSLT